MHQKTTMELLRLIRASQHGCTYVQWAELVLQEEQQEETLSTSTPINLQSSTQNASATEQLQRDSNRNIAHEYSSSSSTLADDEYQSYSISWQLTKSSAAAAMNTWKESAMLVIVCPWLQLFFPNLLTQPQAKTWHTIPQDYCEWLCQDFCRTSSKAEKNALKKGQRVMGTQKCRVGKVKIAAAAVLALCVLQQ